MIRELKISDLKGLNSLPPDDWGLDYETYLLEFLHEDYFHAFVLIHDEKIVGTGNVLIKGKIGWLANIIVSEAYRGIGLGFKMTKFLVDFLISKKCETQLLIATDLGEPVYQKVGFEKIINYQCFETTEDIVYKKSNSIKELKEADQENVYNLDQITNGENRIHLISKYYKNGVGYFNFENKLLGFYLPNFGRGLIISSDKKAGIELLKLKHSKKGKQTFLPINNCVGFNFLNKEGLKRDKQFSKMFLGKKPDWIPKNIYSYGSGFCG